MKRPAPCPNGNSLFTEWAMTKPFATGGGDKELASYKRHAVSCDKCKAEKAYYNKGLKGIDSK